MNDEKQQRQEIVLTIVYAQLMIEQIDNLQGYPKFYRNKVKLVAKNLQKLLESKIDRLFDNEETTLAEASDQLADVSKMCWKLSVALLNVEDKHHTGFTNEFRDLLLKYYVSEELVNELFEID